MNFQKIALNLCFVLFTFSAALATDNANPEAERTAAHKELTKLISKIDFDWANQADKTIQVQFMLNANKEIVVLKTSDDELDSIIKYSLNYKQLKSAGLEANKIYILPVQLKSQR